MDTIFLTIAPKDILLKTQEKVKDNNEIMIIHSKEADYSYLTLNAPNPNELLPLWEMITNFSTIGGAVAFIILIRDALTKEQSSVSVTTNKGLSIEINTETSDIQIQEFAEKTVINISKNV